MSSLALLVVAVVAGAAGVAVASRAGRGPVGWSVVLLAMVGAGAAGVVGGAVLVAGEGTTSFWDLLHLGYLGVTVTGPLLAVGLGILAVRRSAPRGLGAVLVVALLPAPLGFYATHVEPYRLRVDHHVVAVDPARAGDDEVRIAVLADLQTNRVGDHERRAVDEVLAAEPDLILLPGDLFQGTDAELDDEVEAMRALLGRLEAPHGVFYVRGDVDGGGHAERVLEGTGIEVLDDAVAVVEAGDRTLRIGGTRLDYASAAADATRDELEREPPDGAITILLGHRPDTALRLPSDARTDLTVAGHTHGGQIVVPLIGPLVTFSDVPRHVGRGGLHEIDGNPIYVSPGVGVERGEAPQVRFLNRPAIGILTLRDR